MLTRRDRIALWLVVLLTGLVGVVNLFSAVTPGLPNRIHWLKEIFPFEARASGHLFAALTGFFLLVLATNLLRRKRVAWLLAIALLSLSIVNHLIKGWDYEEGILSAILIALLLRMRHLFTAQSDRPSIAQGIKILLGALLFTLAYGTTGFYLLDRHYSVDFNGTSALMQTIALFFTDDNAGLQPTTRFGRYFVNSIYIISVVTLGYAVVMLLRPVLSHRGASLAEQKRARLLVEKYGRSSLAQLTLLSDKVYYFSPSGQTVIAYVAKGRTAIALGDPIGAPGDRAEAIFCFQQFCAQNDWHPVFYQTLPDDLECYQSLGFKALQIGEEAIVDLQTFTLEGKAGRNLRTPLNKLTKAGHQIEFHAPPISAEMLHELKQVSNEWLHLVQGSEKRFSVGWFDEHYLRDCEIVTIRTPKGTISAFANVISEYQLNEITIDLMRHRVEIENGTMDFLFIGMFQKFKEKGYGGFNLGLSVLSGVGDSKQSLPLEKGVRYLSQHLEQFYSFQGLHEYKEKFHPRWEPRYLIYPSLAALPDVLVGLGRVDSGDRLLDYFKPGS